jgi:hypothetical protein
MDFTFGIVTTGYNDEFLENIIESIVNNNIENYEIIIVGNTKIQSSEKVKIICFDESIRNGWITRKKNIIVNNAKYDNIVLMHDYIKLNDDWYSGFLKFGSDYDWCVTKIFNKNGQRFRDYTLHTDSQVIDHYFRDYALLPYDFKNNIKTNNYMYISGSYYVIKKHIAQKHLLNENLCWNQGDDYEYTRRLHFNGIIIKCNPFSSVSFLKEKHPENWEKQVDEYHLQKFIDYCK